MDGYEVCARLKADKGTGVIPVILAGVAGEARHKAFAAGGADYVTTPYVKEEVLTRVGAPLALKALQEAEAAGRDLVENLSDVIYTADGEGVLTYVSPAIEPFLGYTPSEMIGRHFGEFFQQEELSLLTENFQRILAGHSTANEYRTATKSGEVRWMRTSSQPAFEGDRMVGVQGVLTDITERKEAEEQSRAQNEFLTSVLESLTHPFYVVDAHDYTIQIANSAARLGSPPGGTTCYALTHGRSSPCGTADHPCPVEEIRRTKKPVSVEHVHYDADGRLRNVEVHGYPLFDAEGNVFRIIEYTLDITERKQAEEGQRKALAEALQATHALRESEENWRSLTEYSPDHIMLLDREANILFINRTLPELSREQVLDTSFYDYALEESREATQACFERVLRTGQPDRFESVYEDAGGHRTTFESHVGPVMRSGEVWGLVVRSTDITEFKQAQEALGQLAHELGERVKELNCLYGISRLAGIQGITLGEILQGTIDLIPPAWLHPEVTSARVVLEGQEFKTENFEETRWRQASDLVVHGERVGTLEVCLLEEKQEHDEGPFLKEERPLIDAIAERLGRITERMRAEEGQRQALAEALQATQALRQSEQQYRQLLDALQEGIWVIDQDAMTTLVNPRMAEMLGYTVEEMQGRHLYSFMDERGVKITERNLKRREEGIKEQHDFEFMRKDGSRIYTLLETAPLFDDDGNYVGGIAGIQDITHRRRAEQALREAKEAAEAARREEQDRRQEADRRRQIAESLADVLAALNTNQPLSSVLDYIAAQARQLLDNQAVAVYRLQGADGRLALQGARGLPASCVTGTDQPPGLGALGQAIASRQPVVVPDLAAAAAEEDRLAPQGQRPAVFGSRDEWCQALLAVPIVVKDEVYGGLLLYYAEPQPLSGEEVELAAVFSDQVALAIENARLREQVERAATTAERSRLARDLHDSVTQALFSASLVAEVLPQVWRRDPDEGQEGLEELRHLTRSALAEMRTLLLELRPSALVETKLGDLLQQLTEAITSRAQLEVRLDVAPAPTLPPDVHVTFYRVAQEALHNAVKYAEASRMVVSLRASPPFSPRQAGEWRGQVILHVSDDGRGFDPGLSEPDQLGLAIMRERAEAVGAMLDVESQPGQGTQITLAWQNR
jgi:PAS domain S-box-containing protein